MARRLTGFTPSGRLHLGNLVGAIRPIVARQAEVGTDTVIFISDLHALTLEHDPAAVRRRTLEFARLLLAAGTDPERCLFLVQSHVPQHTELHYLLECVAGYGEAQRMIQFKEKSARQEQVRMSLLTYPILMAADILLYDTAEVPVGEDQKQHVELARDLAGRFNARYGATFTLPEAVNPPIAARLRDLTAPEAKMSKSSASDAGVLLLLDEPATLRRKVMRAVTDSDDEVRYDPAAKPGVSNLLDVLAACTGGDPRLLAADFDRYGELKAAVADAVLTAVGPIRERALALEADPGYVRKVLRAGAERARELAEDKVRQVKEAIGLLEY
ncbi:MAG TPA: tryptophan--tRNA ligase [Actinospica sp.]|nr:tryptophan--tRNA ligase [Actinospica sp.]